MEFLVLLSAYEKAFLTDDHPKLLGLMAENIVFCDPLCREEITSKAALRAYLSQGNDVMTNVTQKIVSRSVDKTNGNVALQWLHSGTNKATGDNYNFPGVTCITITDGLLRIAISSIPLFCWASSKQPTKRKSIRNEAKPQVNSDEL